MSLYSRFCGIFSSFDVFKSPIIPFFDRKKNVSSKIGVFLSFVLITIIVMNFTRSDFILKQSPYIVPQNIQTFSPIPVDFNKQKIIWFSVSDNTKKHYYEPTIFEINLYVNALKSINGTMQIVNFTKIPLKPCLKEDLDDPLLFEKYAMNNTYCLVNPSFTLSGGWNMEEISYAYTVLEPCNNETSNNTCQSAEYISDFFSRSIMFFGCEMHSSLVEMDNYKNPLKIKMKSIFQRIDIDFYKSINVYFKYNQIFTEDGWFFSNNHLDEDFTISESELAYDFSKRRSTFFSMVFYASNELYRVQRRYQTFSEALASCTGIANFFILLFLFFVKYQTYLKTKNTLMDQLYYFPKLKSTKKDNADKNKETKINSEQNDLKFGERKKKNAFLNMFTITNTEFKKENPNIEEKKEIKSENKESKHF